jgi:hypothetical protein
MPDPITMVLRYFDAIYDSIEIFSKITHDLGMRLPK